MNSKSFIQFMMIIFLVLFFLVPPSWAGKREDAIIKYYEEIHAKIAAAWDVPRGDFGKGKEPESEIIFFINERGKMTSYEWKAKSNYEELDVSCLKAIQGASPFPLPPTNIWLHVFQRGLLVVCRPTAIRLGATGSHLCAQAEQKLKEGYVDINLVQQQQEPYFSTLSSLIRKKYWFSTLAQQRIVESAWGGSKILDAMVGLEIASSGEIRNVEIFCPSSSSVFNEELLRILKKMKSFPSPPAHLIKGMDDTLKIIFSFSLYIKQ